MFSAKDLELAFREGWQCGQSEQFQWGGSNMTQEWSTRAEQEDWEKSDACKFTKE